MADVIEDLAGQVSKNQEQGAASGPARALAAADTWLMVASVSSELCRSNATGNYGSCCFTQVLMKVVLIYRESNCRSRNQDVIMTNPIVQTFYLSYAVYTL